MAWDQGRGPQEEAAEVGDARRGVTTGGKGGAWLLPPGGEVELLHRPGNEEECE